MRYWEDVLTSLVKDAKSTKDNATTYHSAHFFTCFSNLPFELRRKIWIFALPGPRAVTIKSRCHTFELESLDYVRAIATPPALLHTTNESREVALEFYELSFGAISKGHPVYIDFQVDILYLKGWGSVTCLRDEIEILDAALYPDTPYEQDRRYIEDNVRCIVFGSMAASRLGQAVNYYSGLSKLECVALPDPEAGDGELSYSWYDFSRRLEDWEDDGCHWSLFIRVQAGNMVDAWKSLLKDRAKEPGILLMETEALESIAMSTNIESIVENS
jgi:hypothetical protein